MTITITGKTVVFDYGEVISAVPSGDDRSQLLTLARCDAGELWDAYWRHRDALDRGQVSVKQYWQRIAGDLDADWDDATLHRLWLADFRGWLALNPETLELLVDLQKGGTRMALHSNAGQDFVSYYRYGMIGDFFDHVFVSCELGVLKPSPKAFLAMLQGLGAEPDEVLFIDDREANVRGAESLGICSHLYTNTATLRAFLNGFATAPSTPSDRPTPKPVAL